MFFYKKIIKILCLWNYNGDKINSKKLQSSYDRRRSVMRKTSFIFLLVFISPLMGLVQYPIYQLTDGTVRTITIQILVSFLLLITIIFYLYRHLINDSIIELFQNNRFDSSLIKISIAMLILNVIFIVVVIKPNNGIHNNLFTLTGFNNHYLQIISVCTSFTLSPIIDELFFRGLLISFLEKTWNSESAIIFSAIIFGISHSLFNIIFLSFYIIVGILLGIAREKTNGIIAPIILRSMWDVFIVLMMWIY